MAQKEEGRAERDRGVADFDNLSRRFETTLANANKAVDQAKGVLDGPRQSFSIGANDQLVSSAGYRDLIIAYKNGAALRLSDAVAGRSGASRPLSLRGICSGHYLARVDDGSVQLCCNCRSSLCEPRLAR